MRTVCLKRLLLALVLSAGLCDLARAQALGVSESTVLDFGTVVDESGSITLGADLTVASATAAPGADQALSFTVTVNYN